MIHAFTASKSLQTSFYSQNFDETFSESTTMKIIFIIMNWKWVEWVKKATTGNQIHVSQVLNIEIKFLKGISKLPVGKQLIEAITTGPSNAPRVQYAWSNSRMLPNHFKLILYHIQLKCTLPAQHVPAHTIIRSRQFLKWAWYRIRSIPLLVCVNSFNLLVIKGSMCQKGRGFISLCLHIMWLV